MARPKRSGAKPNSEATVELAEDDAIKALGDDKAIQDDVDEREKELNELRAKLAAGEKAAQELRDQLKNANDRVTEATISNEDFREKPKPGSFFYYLVRFDPKRNVGDTEHAEAAVNGNWVTWPRGRETGLRSDYKEVLENAVQAKFTVLPGEDRKQVGSIQTYTFNILKRITKAEYEALLKKGNRELQATIDGA